MVSEDVKAYVSSLTDLTFNSKPLINMLTMLADENVAHAAEIVEVVENHLAKVKTDVKLPILYLIDCIVKNVGGPYTELFSQNIVATFCSVFRMVDEKTRAEMFKLRQTWNDVFSPKKLYAIDVQIRVLDPAWPVTAPPPSSSIHFNPKFLKNSKTIPNPVKTPAVPVTKADPVTLDMQQQLIEKQKELLELQQKKLELELLQTKVRLREQIKSGTTPGTVPILPQNVLLKPEVAKQLLPSRDSAELDVSNSTKSANNLLKNQKMQLTGTNSGPRIQPANSALVAAAVNRPTRDPRLLKQQTQPSQITSNVNVQLENKNNLESSNKIVNNKASVRDIQNDPRIKNDNNIPSQKFTDVDKSNKSKVSPSKSRSDKSQTKSTSSRSKSHSDDSRSSKSSSSQSSLESPKKSRSLNEKSTLKNNFSNRDRKKEDGKRFKSTGREPKISKSDTSLPVFKDAKNSKNRNYIRRNRSPQFSPEPQDVDLRLTGPPEKQQRLAMSPEKVPVQKETSPNPLGSIQKKDVDLRQRPSVMAKKRLTDSPDQNANKRNKTEIFDVLFGNEDTDLRKLPVPTPDRPPTPPPPIISLKNNEDEKEPQIQKPDLEAVRAKLAANIKKTSPKSFKKKITDEDFRNNQTKIVISKAEGDKIKEGAMTTSQQKKLMNKIIAQIENQKLIEAKKKNFDDTFIETTPISDEEMDDFKDDKRNIPVTNAPGTHFGDKDERIMPHVPSSDENVSKRFGKDFRRGGSNWRGIGRGRRPWDIGPRPPIKPWLHQQPIGSLNFRPTEFDRKSPENEIVVEPCNQDDIKTITIDGLPRDIRYYDEIGVIFIHWNEPREISFQDGFRRVIFNDTDIYTLNFNEPYRELRIGETLHQIRLGGPSREIYIDFKPYECYFGGPGITIDLNGKVTSVKLDGPPPQVKIGELRTDLVAGKIKLIIDAKTIVPIFIDAKIQSFTFDDEQHTVQFLPGLKSVLINDEHFDVEFGGLPKPIILKNKRHYIRFTVLPKGIKPGHVRIKGLESEELGVSSPRTLEENVDVTEPALPIPQRIIKSYDPNMSPDNSSSGTLFQNVFQQQNLNNLDFLTNVISSSEQPTNNTSSYQVENIETSQQHENVSNPSTGLFNLNSINDLFQKLVASGMVTTTSTTTSSVITKEPPSNVNTSNQNVKEKYKTKAKKSPPLKHISFSKPEQLKIRQGALYEKLYNGMQCSSCGTRFPPEQSIYYSQHLDWHFRQNRKGKKNARIATSRKWYYSINDWQNYEEIENLEEREKNFFDQQQQDDSVGNPTVEDAELPSVNADPELQDICEVCGDKFEIFFNEDKEEWQFKNAIRNEDKIYHPICHEEYQQSLLNEETNKENQSNTTIPGIEIVLDDDEDIEKSSEIVEEVILDESDESKLTSEDKKDEHVPETPEYEDEDDDVIIKEETIEQIVLDDDDDKMDDDDEETQMSSESSSHVISPKNIDHSEVIDDGFVDVNEGLLMLKNGGDIKVKTEPIDEEEQQPDDSYETPLPDEQETSVDVQVEETREQEMEVDQPHATFLPSIDGNLEMDTSAPPPVVSVSGKIKINILKPLPVVPAKDNNKDMLSGSDNLPETIIDPSQPLPPGEEPNLLKLKPALQNIELKQMPPVQKGSELTGMCSIM